MNFIFVKKKQVDTFITTGTIKKIIIKKKMLRIDMILLKRLV